MKNAEGSDSPLELERRLKAGVDQLRKMTDSLEELVHLADTLGPILGVAGKRGRAGSGPAARTAGGQSQEGRGTAATPPGRQSQTPPASTSPAQAPAEEIPEWRKLFPGLAAEVPHRKTKGGS